MPSRLPAATLVFLAVAHPLTIGCGGGPSTGSHRSAAVPIKPLSPVPYQIVEVWGIPNGGFGRVIVISPAQRNEKDMRALGETLRYNTRGDHHANITIYDDERAARLRRNALSNKLSASDMAFHDAHLIGFYNRNGNTGNNELNILLGGANGPVVTVSY